MSKKKVLDNTASYQDSLIETLKNPKEADLYLSLAMEEYHEDGDIEVFLLALRNIAEANGGLGKLAKKTHLNRQNLYAALSSSGNPTLLTLELVLKALGYRLAIQRDVRHLNR